MERQKAEQLTKSYYPLRPSSAGYCGRKLAYELAAFQGKAPKIHEDRKANIMRLLALGHTIEYHALKFLEEIPGFSVKFKQQVVSMFKLPSGRIVEGSTDAVMWSEEHKALLDVKTVGVKFSSYRESTWEEMADRYDAMDSMERFDVVKDEKGNDLNHAWYVADLDKFLAEISPDDALVANVTQINLYLCTDFMQERGVKFGVVYRYCKNNSKHMEIRFAPSFKLFNAIKDKYSVIESAVANDAVDTVPRGAALGSQACGFCPYKNRCRPNEDTKKAYYRNLPKKNWADKLSEMEGAPQLRELFAKLEEQRANQAGQAATESLILKELEAHEVSKVKLDDGSVYEVKTLKSPYPHQELRRGKE